MGISKTTAPAFEPVTLEEAQAQVRNWQTGQEDILTGLIVAAREVLEEATNRTFVNAGFTYTRTGFPGSSRFEMPRSPLVSVTTVKYYDTANTQQTLDVAYYSAITNEPRGYLWLNETYSWPSTY